MITEKLITLSKKIAAVFISLCLIACLTPSAAFAGTDAASAASDEGSARISKMIAGMTTEEKVCQMIMLPFRYYTDESGNVKGMTELLDKVKEKFEKYNFAGMILYAVNTPETEQTVKLIDDVQLANAKNLSSGTNRPQLFIAVDQEGGRVTRIGQGTAFSGNMALGAINDEATTKTVSTIIGKELQALGFNMNFAPVVDVNNNPSNPVIGVRSFSDDPNMVAKHVVAYTEGIMSTNTIATLKHFPGHGDTETDSHTGFPVINKTYAQLQKNELIPFKAGIDAGVEAIMTAHIQFPYIEETRYVGIGEDVSVPATLSKKIITDILRNEMGFKGVVITDALDMDAIKNNFDPMDSARFAIEAGADILLTPVSDGAVDGKVDFDRIDKYIEDLTVLVDEGSISMEKVDSALKRILTLKYKHGLLDSYKPSDLSARTKAATAVVGSKENHAVEMEQAKKSLTLVKNEGNMLPMVAGSQKIGVLTAADDEIMSMQYAVNLLKEDKKIPTTADITVISTKGKSKDEVLNSVKGFNSVILVSEAANKAALDPNNEKWEVSTIIDAVIDKVHADGAKIAIISTALPYDAARYTKADAMVIAWNSRGMSEDPRENDGPVVQYGSALPAALYQMLSPDAVFSGKLPVNIPVMGNDYTFTSETLYSRGFGLKGGFDKKQKMTYKEALQLLCDAAGKDELAGTDEVIKNLGTDFRLDAAISRQDFIVALYYFTQNFNIGSNLKVTKTSSGFSDFGKVTGYAKTAVEWAVGTGVLKGTSASTIDPDKELTRAQALTMLMRLN